MKRAFPQKVKLVSCHLSDIDSVAEQTKQTPAGVHRRTRTSAAMIGLALSMGASSLLLPSQDDSAVAAEPVSVSSSTAHAPVVPGVAKPSSIKGSQASDVKVEHVVQGGDTLWQLSRRYRVPVNAIASANGISTTSLLKVGQVVVIPTQLRAFSQPSKQAVGGDLQGQRLRETFKPSPAVSLAAVEQEDSSSLDDIIEQLKTDREAALARLRSQREELKLNLATPELNEASTVSVPEKIALDPQLSSESEQAALSSDESEADTAVEPVAQVETSPQATADVNVHQVSPGETLGEIAVHYQTSEDHLASINHLPNPNQIQAEQSLIVPSVLEPEQDAQEQRFPSVLPKPVVAEPELVEDRNTLTYRVNPGDTIEKIAHRYDIPRSSLIATNQINNPNLILVGQVLQVPLVSATAEAPAEVALSSPVISQQPAASDSVVPTTQPSEIQTFAPSVPEDLGQTPKVPDAVPETMVVADAPLVVPPATGGEYPSSEESVVLPNGGASQLEASPSPEASVAVAASPSPETSVAVAPLVGAPEPSSETSASNPYVERLLAEVFTMRDRYIESRVQDQVVRTSVVATASLSTLTTDGDVTEVAEPERINPELRASYGDNLGGASSQVSQPEVTATAESVSTSDANEASPAPADDQLVAVAPMGSENYRPLLQPITGQLVSPELPPLADAEAYLPDGTAQFDGYIWPARGVLTSGYGWRWGRMHRGIDIGAPVGTPVYAAADGVVEFSGWNSGGYGNMVEIRHADGSMTRYAHHSRNIVRAGQNVHQGDQIAEVGSTGYSTGPHLHFEVHLPAQGTVNPIAYLPSR